MELKEAKFIEVRDGSVSGLDGDDELDEGHLLKAHQIHGWQVFYEPLHNFYFPEKQTKSIFCCFALGIGFLFQI